MVRGDVADVIRRRAGITDFGKRAPRLISYPSPAVVRPARLGAFNLSPQLNRRVPAQPYSRVKEQDHG
jgi:hypothetical protein